MGFDNIKLKQIRIQRGKTLLDVAKAAGFNTATVQKYESGTLKNPSTQTVQKLADALGCMPNDLMDWGYHHAQGEDEGFLLPIVGRICAGKGMFASEDIEGYKYVSAAQCKNNKNCFLLKVKGDSMDPIIIDGDYLIVRPQKSVDSGKLAVVLVDSEEASAKRIIYGPDWIELRPENQKYPPRVFVGKDVLNVYVNGLIIGVIREYE